MPDLYYNDAKKALDELQEEDFSFLNEDLLDKIEVCSRECEYLLDEYKNKAEAVDELASLLEENNIDYSHII